MKRGIEIYLRLRKEYNDYPSRLDLFYLLLVFGFNHMTRFNHQDQFNLPVGNVDWNPNTERALYNYADFARHQHYRFFDEDFVDFIRKQHIYRHDFIYLDPPYLISHSQYNQHWGVHDDQRLFDTLDALDRAGVPWGMSNVLTHKGRTNHALRNWATQYDTYSIRSNYISHFDNTVKSGTHEIYVTNYHRSSDH